VLLLAAMDIANDYFQVRDLKEELTGRVEDKAGNLIDYIDSQV
jgi:hypothetical protein